MHAASVALCQRGAIWPTFGALSAHILSAVHELSGLCAGAEDAVADVAIGARVDVQSANAASDRTQPVGGAGAACWQG